MIWITFISALSFTAVILFLRGGIYRIEQTYATGDNDNINNNHLTYSVIIAARNEERNIAECLKTVFAQDNVSRSNFEVIVVDDRSEDATPNILLDLKNQYDNLKIITVTKTPFGISPKKYAVSKGIESASNEIIVFTDADCRVPPRWLSTIEKYFTPDTAFVQGITSYTYIKYINRLFWGLQSVDFLSHGIVAAAAIGAGLPINANANNLAFRKSVFQEIGGYGSDGRVVSADDDQLLQRFWKARRQKRLSSRYQEIKFMADPSGGVETTPTETAAGIFEQRKRWGSVTVHYGVGQIILLSSVFLFYMMIAFSACASIFDAYFLPICACLIFVKLSGEMVLMLPGTRIFNKKNLRKYIPLASIIQLPLVLAAVLFGVFGKFNWKGRKLGRIID